MNEVDPKSTFRGLPLTPEQDAEIRHYIKVKKQHAEPWDTPELSAMLRDMLEPPGDEESVEAIPEETKAAAERAAGAVDDEMEQVEASEERKAAMELESMKGPKR